MNSIIPLFIGLFLYLPAFAQEYSCLSPENVQFFTNEGIYRAIKIDSSMVFVDHTTHYNFFVLGSADDPYCYSSQHPSWIGSRVNIYENGDHYFFNVAGDSILVKTNGEISEEWISYYFDDGNVIHGKLISMELMEFLGITDSVKTVQFNAFDINGNPFVHAINGKQIKVSKNHGMVQALNFKLFPDLNDYPYSESIGEYSLCGIQDPETGIQNLTIDQIFDFDPGDEIHIHEQSYSFIQLNHEYFEIHKVLNKEFISDSVVNYDFERCTRRHYFQSGNVVLNIDTVSIEINFNNYEDPNINELPDKLIFDEDGDSQYYWYLQYSETQTGKMAKYFWAGYYYDLWQDCIVDLIDYYYCKYYLEGLGGPFWDYGDFGFENLREPVYYKKGAEVWGTPYSCDSLLTIIPNRMKQPVNVTLTPNPMQEFSVIKINNKTGKDLRLQIFNAIGKKVKEDALNGSEYHLQRGNLPNGLYYIRIFNDAGFFSTKKLLVY